MQTPPTRAPRFSLHLPLRYRAVGQDGWHAGRTLNISRTGVLFRSEHLLGVDTPVEIALTLHPPGPGPEVLCHGRIVRSLAPSEADTRPGLAATIAQYCIVRGPGISR